MAKVKIQGHASGTGVLTVTAHNTSTDRTLTLPDSTDTLAVNSDVTNKLPLAGGTLTGNTTIATNSTPKLILKRTGNNAGNGYIECHGADDSVDYKIAFAQSNGVMSFDVGGTRMLGVTSDGLCFNSDTASANALDDYEEGDWTPTLTGSGTISHRVGKYVKIGNQIMVQGEIRSTSYNNSGSTDIEIGGLPYSSLNVSNYNFAANITPVAGFNSNATQGIAGYVTPNTSKIRLYGVNFSAGANYDELQTGEMGTTVEVFFAVHYRTN